MVCPNCQADDNVLIQGQNFCLNCGFLIPEISAPLSETVPVIHPPAPPSLAVTATPAKPDNTIDSLVDDPEAVAVPQAAIPTVPKLSATEPAPKPAEAKPEQAHPAPIAKPTAQSKPAGSMDSMSKPHAPTKPHRTTPSPSRPKTAPVLPAVLPVPQSLPHASPSKPLMGTFLGRRGGERTPGSSLRTVGRPLASAHTTAVYHSLKRRDERLGTPAIILTVAPVAIWLTARLSELRTEPLPLGLDSIWRLATQTVGGSTGLGAHLGLIGIGLVVAYTVLGIITKLWAVAALTHGYAKQLDERPVDTDRWSRAAWNALPDIVRLALVALASTALIVVALGALTSYVLPGLPAAFRVVGAVLGLLLAVYAASVLAARTIYAGQAIVLGGLDHSAARKLGGRLYRADRLRALGMALVSGLMIVLVVAATFALMVVLALVLQASPAAAYVGYLLFLSVFVFGLAYHYLLTYLVVLWLQQYRDLIALHLPDLLVPLTLGRSDQRAEFARAIILSLSLGLVSIAITVVLWYSGVLHIWSGDTTSVWYLWR